jgi:phenylacetic acid degradation operon negative regulatory protein
LEDDLRYVVAELQATEYVDIFTAEHLGFRDTGEAVGQWWDLESLGQRYAAFSLHLKATGVHWKRARDVDPTRAFTDYTRALTAWRNIPYADPGLPAEFLPRTWPGTAATSLFFALHDRLSEPALGFARRQ